MTFCKDFPSEKPFARVLLGGSWVDISEAILPLIWVISIVTLLITPLITSHEPASAYTTPQLHLQQSTDCRCLLKVQSLLGL